METLLIFGALAAIAYLLIKQKPAAPAQMAHPPEGSAAPAAANVAGGASPPAWLRQAVIFAVSLIVAFIAMSFILSTWFGIATKLGAMVGISGNLVTLIVLGGIAFYIYRTNAAPRIRAFALEKWATLTGEKQEAVPVTVAPPIVPPVATELPPVPPAPPPPAPPPPVEPVIEEAVLSQEAAPIPMLAPEAPVIVEPEPAIRSTPEERAATVPADEVNDQPAPEPRKRMLLIAGAAVVATGGLAYATSVVSPQAFGTAVGWAKGLVGMAGDDGAAESGDVVAGGASAEQAEEVAVDQLIQEFMQSALTAKAAREAIANRYNAELAAVTDQSEADKIRTAIAEKEQAIAEARRSAQDSLALLAEAMAADPAIVDQAIGIVRGLPEVRQNANGSELLSALSENKGLASQPEKFVAAAMAVWERAASAPVGITAQPTPAAVTNDVQGSPAPVSGAGTGNAPTIRSQNAPAVQSAPPQQRTTSQPQSETEIQRLMREKRLERERQRERMRERQREGYRRDREPSDNGWENQPRYGPDLRFPTDEFQR